MVRNAGIHFVPAAPLSGTLRFFGIAVSFTVFVMGSTVTGKQSGAVVGFGGWGERVVTMETGRREKQAFSGFRFQFSVNTARPVTQIA